MHAENEPIRILIVEDLPSDVEMAVREIKKGGINFTWQVADNEKDFINLLPSFSPDIIVSDYSMPSFDGLSSLLITRSLQHFIPFIILTGSMNEETAVACMKAGANDYVIKEQIKRLPFAIKEAIENTKAKSEKSKLEKQLQESERKYRNLAESVSAILWEYDLTTDHWTYIAPQVKEMLGYAAEEWTNSTFWIDRIHPMDKKWVLEAFRQQTHQRNDHVIEYRFIKSDGTTIWLRDNIKVEYKNTKPQKLFGLMSDITNKKKSEEIQKFLYVVSQLAISTMHFDDYLKTIHHELKNIIKADNFYIALYNKKTDTYTLPYHVDEFEDLSTQEPVSLQNTLTDYIRRSGTAQLITEKIEQELRLKENIKLVGEPSPIWLGAPLINSSTNEVTGIIALQDYKDENAYNEEDLNTLKIIAANIGIFLERRQTIEKLRISELRFKSFLNSTTDFVLLKDENSRMIFINKTMRESLNLMEEEAIGKTIFDLLPEDVAKQCKASDKKALQEGVVIKVEENWGNQIHESLKFPIDLGNGKTGIGAFIRNITEKKKMLESLVMAKEKAEESDRLKSAFLANISHEIRTPMNGILGFINLLEEPSLNEKERSKYFSIIDKSSQRLLATINDIIEIAKLDAGQSEVVLSTVDSLEMLQFYYDFFQPQAQEKGISLKITTQVKKEEARIITDNNKLAGILTNLIKNAIKFTRNGTIEIGNSIQNNHMTFFVKDTGVGIPPHKINAIFERFVQADLSLTRAHEGSGLGLAIVKAYLDSLGGKIHVESTPGKGSTFAFEIPLHHTQQTELFKKKTDPKHNKIKQKTILIAEDDPSSRIFLEAVIRPLGYAVCLATSGNETLEKVKENPDIALILMDIKMPGIDGLEATRLIRGFNATVPIIAQTAYSMAGEKEKAIQSGCNEYLAKPIKRDDLIKMINDFIKK
ncbi:MAG TPA: response regulator [Bacteroidales bacterium]|nr:response regulator [Bacteroidales bacterium]